MQNDGGQEMIDSEELSPVRAATGCACFVVAVASWEFWLTIFAAGGDSDLNWIEAGYRPPLSAIVSGAVALLLAGVSLWRLVSGMIAITWLAFGIARGTPEMEWNWDRGFQTSVLMLAVVGALGNRGFRARFHLLLQYRAKWLLVVAALVVWTLVTESIALLFRDVSALPKHHALRMLESLVLLTLGAAFLGSSLWLMGGALMSLGLAAVSISTANRAANVGLAIGIVVLVALNLRRPRSMILAAIVLGVLGFAALQSPLRPRMEAWVENGWETANLASRLEMWKGAVAVAPQGLAFGVGPGRGGQQMSEHLEFDRRKATHSSPLEMLGEPRVLLWISLLALALHSNFAGVCSNETWIRGLGLGTLFGFVARTVAGLSLSRHEDMRFFWMMGMAFAAGTTASQVEMKTGASKN